MIRALRLAALASLALAAVACGGNAGGDDDTSKADASMPGTPDAARPDAEVPDPPDAQVDAEVPDNCGGVTSRCVDATHLETCVNGNLVPTDCGAGSQVCKADGAGGFGCFDAPLPGSFTVSGKVRYEDKEPLPSGALGAITQKVARGVSVTVVADQGNTVLATGRTGDDGSYSLNYDTTAGAMVHVLAATTSTLPSRPVKVVKSGGSIHGAASASFAAAASVQMDILATNASHLGPAFNIFDQFITAIDAVRVRMGVTGTLQPIKAFWQDGTTDGTYFNGDIHLLGAPDDDDGYDDAVMLHEFGHYVEARYGGTDSPGGGHNGSPTDPRLGWSEGWATYFQAAVRNHHFYMDSNAGGGFGQDLEAEVTKAQAAGAMTQNTSENMIAEILWDFGDGPAGDDDARAGGDRHEDVMKVQTAYLSGNLATRGVAGVDLVDWLDGWFKLQGLSTCAAGRMIVTTTHTFPYDFHASGATCP